MNLGSGWRHTRKALCYFSQPSPPCTPADSRPSQTQGKAPGPQPRSEGPSLGRPSGSGRSGLPSPAHVSPGNGGRGRQAPSTALLPEAALSRVAPPFRVKVTGHTEPCRWVVWRLLLGGWQRIFSSESFSPTRVPSLSSVLCADGARDALRTPWSNQLLGNTASATGCSSNSCPSRRSARRKLATAPEKAAPPLLLGSTRPAGAGPHLPSEEPGQGD